MSNKGRSWPENIDDDELFFSEAIFKFSKP